MNTKYYIAWQLESALCAQGRLDTTSCCVVGHTLERRGEFMGIELPDHELDAAPCPNTGDRAWLESWDEVCVEHQVRTETDVRRPDILLKRNGKVVGAIEIAVTHRVSDEKAAELLSMGVPWLEVRADPALYAYAGGWRWTSPLPVVRRSDVRLWRCGLHQAACDQWHADKERAMAEAAERARHSVRITAARVLDVYYPGRKWYRHIYTVENHQIDGRTHTVVLCRGLDRRLCIRLDPSAPDDRSAAWARIRARYDADIANIRERKHALTDSPMSWARGEVAERIAAGEHWDWSKRDPHPLASRYPRRLFFASSGQEWFLPKEMRQVAWDRPADDPFDAHPAWLQRKRDSQRRENRDDGRRATAASKPTPLQSMTPPALRQFDLHHSTIEVAESPFATTHEARSIFERSPVPLAARLDVADFGSVVANPIASGSVIILELAEQEGEPTRVVVLAREVVTRHTVDRVETILRDARVERVWAAARYDWSRRLLNVPWLPLARDSRLNGIVVLEGRAMLASDFALGFARGVEPCTLDRVLRSGNEVAARLDS